LCSGPGAKNGGSVVGAGGLSAGKSLDVQSRIVFGISGNCGHCGDRGICGPDSNAGVHSLDKDVIACGWEEIGDSEGSCGGNNQGVHTGSGDGVVNSVQIEGKSGWIGPAGANVDDVGEA